MAPAARFSLKPTIVYPTSARRGSEKLPGRERLEHMRAIMTVTGRDRTGIVATVATKLAEHHANIANISQTIMSDYFTMIVEIVLPAELDIADLQGDMRKLGEREALEIHVQSEAIFDAMHRL